MITVFWGDITVTEKTSQVDMESRKTDADGLGYRKGHAGRLGFKKERRT